MSYAVILEMRKRKIGFFMHFIHFVLSITTILWTIVWIAHYLVVKSHNSEIDKQINRLLDAEGWRE